MQGKPQKPDWDNPIPEPGEDILSFMARKKERSRERMAYARAYIDYSKTHQKYTDETVSNIRSAWAAAHNIQGFSLDVLGVMFKIPINTLRDYIYKPGLRKAAAAQIDPNKVPGYKAQVMAIMARHQELEQQKAKDRASQRPKEYSLGELARMDRKPKEPIDASLTEADHTALANARADEKIFQQLDALIGRSPLSIMEVAEVVNLYVRSGNYMSHTEVIQLRRKYAQRHSLS